MERKNIAVILSGGSGARFGGSKPKQFFKIAGKSVIEHTVECFLNNPNIHEVLIVSIDSYVDFLRQKFENVTKVSVIEGGDNRFFSTHNALKFVSQKYSDANMLIHDAVRPFLSQRIINHCIEGLREYSAIDVVIPTADTIIKSDDFQTLSSIPERKFLFRGQTPQCFSLSTLNTAYDIAIRNNDCANFTDDCSVVKKYLPDEKIKLIEGDVNNIKITYQQDLVIADNIFVSNKYDFSSNIEYEKLNGKVCVIFGGTDGIGLEISRILKEHGAIVHALSRRNGVDVRNVIDINLALEAVSKQCSKIDYIINTAGLLIMKNLNDLSDSEIGDIVSTNYMSAINVAKSGYKYLLHSRGMYICFTSSSYTRGRAGYCIYSSSKAAVSNFVQGIADEWIDAVKVNCICPERTNTKMRRDNFGEQTSEELEPKVVAIKTVATMLSNVTGQIVACRIDE